MKCEAAAALKRPKLAFVDSEYLASFAGPAAQENAALLSCVLRSLETAKHGKTLLRRVVGNGLAEIAADEGCSLERVRQKEGYARDAVRRKYGVTA